MKILITGKNSQIGSALLSFTESKHIQCIATDRHTLDITQTNHVNDFFNKTHDFDFVINTAAYTNVDAAETNHDMAHATNCLAVAYLAKTCNQFYIPLIHISTDYVFDGKKSTHYDEEDTAHPNNQYGLSKLHGELAIQQYCPQHIILRTSWVFSEYGKNFVKTIARLCETNKTLDIVCDQFGSPTSAHSIARVILSICAQLYTEKDKRTFWGTYHYADFPATNWHQLAYHIARCKRDKIIREIIPIESKDYTTPAMRPKNSILNTQKIKTRFGIDQALWTTEVERITHHLEDR